jgi:hypothetical protein
MDGTGEHNFQWNNPSSERQVSTYFHSYVELRPKTTIIMKMGYEWKRVIMIACGISGRGKGKEKEPGGEEVGSVIHAYIWRWRNGIHHTLFEKGEG